MLKTRDYFRNGQLDKQGLVNFIKAIKKNTKLSDEDAAVLAASRWAIAFISYDCKDTLRSMQFSRKKYSNE